MAFDLDSTNLKVVLRRGKASSLNGDFEEAWQACKALQAAPGAEALQDEIALLMKANRKREALAHKKQKGEFGHVFDH
jgi:hypothetical protein